MRARRMDVLAQVVQGERVTVSVTHEDWQSFSRAVYPRANREFRRVVGPVGGSWRSFADFACDVDADGRCVSLVHYRREPGT